MKSKSEELGNFHENLYGLTMRETAVLGFVARGMTRKEIAGSLNLSIYTVDAHLRSAYHKLRVKNAAEAVAKLMRRRGPSGWLGRQWIRICRRRIMQGDGSSRRAAWTVSLPSAPVESHTKVFPLNAVMRRVVLWLSLLIFIPSCKNNPIDSGGGFPTKAGPILFISDKSGTSQLYSMNEDGSNVQQLTSESTFPILDAKWSPDGSKIAVVSLTGDETAYP